jgi:hypothetical protein
MEPKLIGLLVLVTLVITILFVVTRKPTSEQYETDETSDEESEKEGFETLEDKIQDRANPLAARQNPLKNPAVPIGISEAKGQQIRAVTAFALNVPTAVPTSTGNFINKYPDTIISPRVDNENSFLGLVKFCKEGGAKGGNPFSDPKFAQNCGMCLSSGSLITGETFTKPTGVVVYQKDKEKAYKIRTNNKYKFPRAIPSLQAAVCKGASVSDDSLPVLALNERDYTRFQKREKCIHGQSVGNECGKCLSNNKYSWVDPRGGIQPMSFALYGMGRATLRVGRQVQTVDLSETQVALLSVGRLVEGTPFSIEVVKGKTTDGPYLYGAMISTNPNGQPYRIGIEKIIEKDATTGSTPRRGTPKLFTEVRMNLIKLMPKPQTERMVLDGQIPLTFVESDQLATFDCDASPFITKQASAELITDDPCARPKGQEAGKYSDACLQEVVLLGGCSADGDYYKNPNKYAGKMNKGRFRTFIEEQRKKTDTDINVARLCLGKDITSPCDRFLQSGGIPDKECLVYLYKNTGSTNRRIGSSYEGFRVSNSNPLLGDSNSYLNPQEGFQTFKSLTNPETGSVNTQYCQTNGTLNPENEKGASELRLVAQNGYKGVRGIDAVRRYLKDIFSKATSNLDANRTDKEGGKKDSWEKCFGIRIADPKISTTVINRNAQGTVTETLKCKNTQFPATWRPQRNRVLATNFFQSGNYEMSFKINPRSQPSGWMNILHVGNGKKDCCDFGNRAPGIWFHPNRFLHVRIGSSAGEGNWGFDTQSLPLNQTTSFRLRCVGNQVICTVNERIFTFTQPGNRPTGRFTVWGSDPWYPPANCDISDFCFEIF